MGSKSRYAKYLLPIILENRKKWYIEPFVGGCNMIDKVDGLRLGADNNFYLISMWKALQRGWEPPKSVSYDEYIDIRNKKETEYPSHLIGYVGFNLSYAGKWWGGYARDKAGKRDYGLEAYNNVMKQIDSVKSIELLYTDYENLDIFELSTIYCDPPYDNSTGYNSSFDHYRFWQWCRDKTIEGHDVFISEYSAPDDFESIWEKEVNNTLVQNTGSKQGIERLFVYKG